MRTADFNFEAPAFAISPDAFSGESFVDGQVGMEYEDFLRQFCRQHGTSQARRYQFPRLAHPERIAFGGRNGGACGGGRRWRVFATTTATPAATPSRRQPVLRSHHWLAGHGGLLHGGTQRRHGSPFTAGAQRIDFPLKATATAIQAGAGCTDLVALQPDQLAAADDGTCEYLTCLGAPTTMLATTTCDDSG